MTTLVDPAPVSKAGLAFNVWWRKSASGMSGWFSGWRCHAWLDRAGTGISGCSG
jgi:hypothetical protein